jgi:membrane-bound lytic murein transglycosylase B
VTRRVAVAAVIVLCGACTTGLGQSDTPVVVIGAASTSAAPTTSSTTSLVSSSTAVTTSVQSTARIDGDFTADELAGELSSVERAAATGDTTAGVHQQLLYRYLAAHPELDDAVLAAVGDDVRPYIERIVRARQFGQDRQAANPGNNASAVNLPAWTIVEPLPADELLAHYREAEAATGIGWYWLAAIHMQETRMGRIIGTSSAGAVGPMQFLPSTWARCCIGDPTNPRDAINGAAVYLAESGGPDDMPAALHEYNPNDSYVATVTAFAENMRDNPQLYDAYREWQVFYASSAGPIRLPVGYSQAQAIDAATYLVDHPDDAG